MVVEQLAQGQVHLIRPGGDMIFNEIYGAYYNAVAKILASAIRQPLNPAQEAIDELTTGRGAS